MYSVCVNCVSENCIEVYCTHELVCVRRFVVSPEVVRYYTLQQVNVSDGPHAVSGGHCTGSVRYIRIFSLKIVPIIS